MRREATMNASNISNIVALIPERVTRMPSGTPFAASSPGACRYPERLAHLARFLKWMSALDPISKEDQTVLGLLSPSGRPTHAGEDDDDVVGEDVERHDEGGPGGLGMG
jgi:hypothetical protein